MQNVKCRICGEIKAQSEFYPAFIRHRNYCCKECHRIYAICWKASVKNKYKWVICTLCGRKRQVKLLNYDAKNQYCHSCAHSYYAAQRKPINILQQHIRNLKKCTICKEYLLLDNFGANKMRWDGLNTFCKNCNLIKTRDYRNRNRNKINAIGKKSYYKHIDRARIRANSNYHFPHREICSIEGCFDLGERHHPDYNNAKNVIWLCRKHHRLLEKVVV